MKFSVLLPTRNRLELLRYAVETVRRQDYQDWEIVISDNASEEDIRGFVDGLGDPRIKYHRTERFLPVTDNWNRALEKSAGDYIIMLGDDDCLMPGYFSTLRRLIEKFPLPDFIYSSAYLYAYPGVLPDFPEGFLQPYGYASFFRPVEDAYWLGGDAAKDLVRESMNFRVCFGYNMQFFTISKRFIDSLKDHGAFFQSPYPDYYAANVSFLMAERILIYPKPLVTIGISPKSFGFFFFNNQEKAGVDFLNNIPEKSTIINLADILLPGTDMNTFWLISMEAIKNNFNSIIKLSANYSRYRFLQTLHISKNYFQESGSVTKTAYDEFLRLLTIREKISYAYPLKIYYKILAVLPGLSRNMLAAWLMRRLASHPRSVQSPMDIRCNNILEVFEKIQGESDPDPTGNPHR